MFVMRKDVLPENYFKVQVHILNKRAQPLRGLKRRPWYLCGLPVWRSLFSSRARGGGQCWGQPWVAFERGSQVSTPLETGELVQPLPAKDPAPRRRRWFRSSAHGVSAALPHQGHRDF